MFITIRSSRAKQQSNRMQVEGPVPMTWTSEEYESSFASTLGPKSPCVFGEGYARPHLLPDPSPTTERERFAREFLEQAQRVMRKLHRSYREVLGTRDTDQEFIEKIARDLGISIATFESRLS